MKTPPYETYCFYLAIKSHFTQKKYDFIKYSGAVKATAASFEKRRDKYYFGRLGKKYSREELIEFLVANFIKGKKWIGEFLEEDAETNYLEYVKRQQAFTYMFDNELSALLMTVNDPRDLFVVTAGSYPKIITEYLGGNISIETLTVLNKFICFDDKFDEKLGTTDIMWSDIRMLIVKLDSFLSYDKKRIRGVLKKHLNT